MDDVTGDDLARWLVAKATCGGDTWQALREAVEEADTIAWLLQQDRKAYPLKCIDVSRKALLRLCHEAMGEPDA